MNKQASHFGVKGYGIIKEAIPQTQAPSMATLFDGISQQLDFSSCGEESSSSSSGDNSDDSTSRVYSPTSACRTPGAQRHFSRSNSLCSPQHCTSPIPYASWRKLRLCDSPSTPKVGKNIE